MLAYRIKPDTEGSGVVQPGRIFIPFGTEVLLCATPTLPQHFYFKHTFNRMKEKGMLEEVDLLLERKIHHHLYKPIKQLVEESLKSA
jgi:hypothetical protein